MKFGKATRRVMLVIIILIALAAVALAYSQFLQVSRGQF